MPPRFKPCPRVWAIRELSGVMGVLAFVAVAPAAEIFVNTASYKVIGTYGASGAGPVTSVDERDFQQTFAAESSPVSVALDFERAAEGPAAVARFSSFMSARADYGSLSVGYSGQLIATTTETDPPDYHTALAAITISSVTSRWQDTITITGDTPGRRIKVGGLLDLSGSVNIDAGKSGASGGGTFGSGAFSVEVIAPNASLPPGEYGTNTWAIAEDNTDPGMGGPNADLELQPPKLISVNMVLFEGTPFTLDYSLVINGVATAAVGPGKLATSRSINWDLDLKHTLNWGGITSVTDADTGEPIAGWSVQSASGVNYANPIPEPAAALLAVPLLLLLRARHRRSF